MMWRADGAGEVYAYVPKTPENDESFNSLPGYVKTDSKEGILLTITYQYQARGRLRLLYRPRRIYLRERRLDRACW